MEGLGQWTPQSVGVQAWSGVRRGSVGLVEGCREEVWVPPQSVGVWAWGSWKECGFKGVQGRVRVSPQSVGVWEWGAESLRPGTQLRSSPRELAGLRGELGVLMELEGAVSTEPRLPMPGPPEEARRGHSGARMLRASLAASSSSS